MTNPLTRSEFLLHGPRVMPFRFPSKEEGIRWECWRESFRLIPDLVQFISRYLGEPTGSFMCEQGKFLVWDTPTPRLRVRVIQNTVDAYVPRQEDLLECVAWLYEQVPADDAADLAVILQMKSGKNPNLIPWDDLIPEVRENTQRRLQELEPLRQFLGW